MKKRYRLQPVRELRDQIRQEAARVVALRREQLAAATAEMLRREQALDECRALASAAQVHLARAAAAGLQAHDLVKRRAHLADLKRQQTELAQELEQQREVVALAEAELEQAVSALSQASKDLRAIDKHREAWRQRMQRAAEQRDQKLLDEISTAAHRDDTNH